jgi:hypothetical protein
MHPTTVLTPCTAATSLQTKVKTIHQQYMAKLLPLPNMVHLYPQIANQGENYPLSPKSGEYQSALVAIEAAAATHQDSIATVPNQMAFPPDPSYGICGTGCSKCICNASNFDVFVCGDPFPLEEVDTINSYGGFMGSLVNGVGHQPW